MLYPSLSNLLEKVDSRYLLVNVIARRARELSGACDEYGDPFDGKPVSKAIEEIAHGELNITYTEDV